MAKYVLARASGSNALLMKRALYRGGIGRARSPGDIFVNGCGETATHLPGRHLHALQVIPVAL